MITLNYGGEEFHLENEPKEMSLAMFEKYFTIEQDPRIGKLEKYFQIFELFPSHDPRPLISISFCRSLLIS